MDMAQLPGIQFSHRCIMYGICRSGLLSSFLMRAYRKAWTLCGLNHTGTTYFGLKFSANIKDLVSSRTFFFGVWEPNISHEIEKRLKLGDTFVDVGANIGYYSLLASNIVGASGSIIAIEASPSIYNSLVSNVQRNRSRNIRAINMAVSDQVGKVTIYNAGPTNRGATSTLKDWRGGEAEAVVEARPLDQILTDDEMRRVRIIKIDVEGAEVPILSQILDNIDNYPKDLTIAVEFSPQEAASNIAVDLSVFKMIFDKFIGAGFSAFGVANEYSEQFYFGWRKPETPRRLFASPDVKTDIFFVREPSSEHYG